MNGSDQPEAVVHFLDSKFFQSYITDVMRERSALVQSLCPPASCTFPSTQRPRLLAQGAFFTSGVSMTTSCPRCGSSHIHTHHTARRAGQTIGAVAGTASGIAGALKGASTGASLGIAAGPAGGVFGSLLGALVGGVVGGGVGKEVGARLGDQIDETYLCNYHCHECGLDFSR